MKYELPVTVHIDVTFYEIPVTQLTFTCSKLTIEN